MDKIKAHENKGNTSTKDQKNMKHDRVMKNGPLVPIARRLFLSKSEKNYVKNGDFMSINWRRMAENLKHPERFYVVKIGKMPGIYSEPLLAISATFTYPGATGKVFDSMREAQEYLTSPIWFVVIVGRITGIFTTYRDCMAQIYDFPDGCYVQFSSIKNATNFYHNWTEKSFSYDYLISNFHSSILRPEAIVEALENPIELKDSKHDTTSFPHHAEFSTPQKAFSTFTRDFTLNNSEEDSPFGMLKDMFPIPQTKPGCIGGPSMFRQTFKKTGDSYIVSGGYTYSENMDSEDSHEKACTICSKKNTQSHPKSQRTMMAGEDFEPCARNMYTKIFNINLSDVDIQIPAKPARHFQIYNEDTEMDWENEMKNVDIETPVFAVKIGRLTGTFFTLDSAKSQTAGYKGSYGRAFSNIQQANEFLTSGTNYYVFFGKKIGKFDSVKECRKQIEGWYNGCYGILTPSIPDGCTIEEYLNKIL